jgi:hypothetical protein
MTVQQDVFQGKSPILLRIGGSKSSLNGGDPDQPTFTLKSQNGPKWPLIRKQKKQRCCPFIPLKVLESPCLSQAQPAPAELHGARATDHGRQPHPQTACLARRRYGTLTVPEIVDTL